MEESFAEARRELGLMFDVGVVVGETAHEHESDPDRLAKRSETPRKIERASEKPRAAARKKPAATAAKRRRTQRGTSGRYR